MKSSVKYTLLSYKPFSLFLLCILTLLSSCSSSPSLQEKLKAAQNEWKIYTNEKAQDFQSSCQKDFKKTQHLLAKLEDQDANGDLAILEQINDLDMLLDKSLGMSSLYRNVHPSPEVRAAADECQQRYINLLTDISLSRPIYDQLVALDTLQMDALDTRYVKKMINNYKRSGVNLDEEAAKLVRYQQSYQAVAQVVSVAKTLFDSLLNATRR